MDNKNVVIAIALSMSVLLFWGAFFETPKPVTKDLPQQTLQGNTKNTDNNHIGVRIVSHQNPHDNPK